MVKNKKKQFLSGFFAIYSKIICIFAKIYVLSKRKRMRNLCLLLPTMAVVVMFFSCNREESMTVSPSTTTRAVGCIFTLNVSVSPEGTARNVIWTSSNPEVATVENGIVTALHSGETTITATVKGSNRRDVSIVTVAIGCNNNRPRWGESLGVVSFKTDQIWKVGEQEWSDVVMATACRKTTFSGGPWGNQDADCRSNLGYGDLFSWCAVIRFQDQLCPDGWRIPSKKDFAQLDVVLRNDGSGQNSYTDTAIRNKYISLWGGTYSGYSGVDGQLGGQGWSAYYWTQSEHSENHGFRMNFHLDGYIFPQGWLSKDNGFVLRCVR